MECVVFTSIFYWITSLTMLGVYINLCYHTGYKYCELNYLPVCVLGHMMRNFMQLTTVVWDTLCVMLQSCFLWCSLCLCFWGIFVFLSCEVRLVYYRWHSEELILLMYLRSKGQWIKCPFHSECQYFCFFAFAAYSSWCENYANWLSDSVNLVYCWLVYSLSLPNIAIMHTTLYFHLGYFQAIVTWVLLLIVWMYDAFKFSWF